ncbi:Pycsar system effector family protein [Caminibacter pacificus]
MDTNNKLFLFTEIYKTNQELIKLLDQKCVIILTFNSGIVFYSLWEYWNIINEDFHGHFLFLKFIFFIVIILFISIIFFSFFVLYPRVGEDELSKNSVIFYGSLSKLNTLERIENNVLKLSDEELLKDLVYQTSKLSQILVKKTQNIKIIYFLSLINTTIIALFFIWYFFNILGH